ncbi:circadian clock protein KaiB [Tolypothrix sp. NIES-4075]|nr:circadian clock protein KaiB [Tolypothrix sp. NIES-4075]
MPGPTVRRLRSTYRYLERNECVVSFLTIACTFMNKVRKTYVLKLYVAGNTANSVRALKILKNILDQEFQGIYALKVIDVLKNPQLAEEDKILATPTLSKILPPPVRKIIGDLSDREKVLIGLDLLYEELTEEDYFGE